MGVCNPLSAIRKILTSPHSTTATLEPARSETSAPKALSNDSISDQTIFPLTGHLKISSRVF